MHDIYNHKRLYYFIYFIFILIFIYAILDFKTSRNTTGEINLDRSLVHVYLFVIIFSLSAYYFYSTVVSRIVISSVKFALWAIAGWILIANVLQIAIAWSVAVQLGLAVLWIFTYHLFSSYLRRFPRSWPLIHLCILIMFGFYCFSVFYGSYTIGKTYNRIAVVNLVYSVLVFLPWLTLIPNRTKRRLCICLLLTVVLTSMKRGALLVLPAMLMTGMFVEAIITKRVFRTTIRAMLSLVLLSTGILAADLASGGYLLARFSMEEISSGSGRVAMYRTIIESLSQSSPRSLFFGQGSGAVEQLLDMAAHNEWLEFIYNFGIVGVFLYALLFLALGFRLVNLVRKSSRFAQGYAMAVVYLFVVGLFGQIYFAHSTFYIMAFLGAVEGLMINEARNARVLSVSCDQCRQQGAV